MRYRVDHDLHNHSMISPCSNDPRQTREAVLAYAVTNGYRLVCLTDHAWDAKVECPCPNPWLERGVDLERIRSNLPLPQAKNCRFLFGCEIDMNRFGTLGISAEEMERFDFVILSTSHLNLAGFTIDPQAVGAGALERKEYYKERLHHLLDMEWIPFHKTGLAHFTTANVCNSELIRCLELFSDEELGEIFTKVQRRGMGVELNFIPKEYTAEQLPVILRPYRIAKECGCQFYFGGDAHNPERFSGRKETFESIVDLLSLQESDKFSFVSEMIACIA